MSMGSGIISKYTASILLIAGTCIGGGTIALPMVFAKLGILPSLIVMILVWIVTYYTSLVSVELNLQSDQGLPLNLLGRKFSGKIAEIIGETSIKLLTYALLVVFFSGATSVIQELFEVYELIPLSELAVESGLTIAIFLLLLCPFNLLSKVNNIFFIVFAVIFLVLIGSLVGFTNLRSIPWVVEPSVRNIGSILSVVFTSFGYQVIFHTLRDYCGRNEIMLRRVFFWGSFLPVIVYMLWTSLSLSAISESNPEFFTKIVANEVQAGDFIRELSAISGSTSFHILTWWMSIFAILTSIIGVGIAIASEWDIVFQKKIQTSFLRKINSVALTVLPAYIIAILIPNAFLKVLGFAGAILVIIAIWLPTFLLFKAYKARRLNKLYIPILKKWPLLLGCLAGLLIVIVELSGI